MLSALYQSDILYISNLSTMGMPELVFKIHLQKESNIKNHGVQSRTWIQDLQLLQFTHGVKLRSRNHSLFPLDTHAHVYFLRKAHPERNTNVSLSFQRQTKSHRHLNIYMLGSDSWIPPHLQLVCTFLLEVGRGLECSQCRVQLSAHGWRLWWSCSNLDNWFQKSTLTYKNKMA